MKTLFSLAIFFVFLSPGFAQATETYACSFGGYPTGVVTISVILLSETEVIVNEMPPLMRIQNPVQVTASVPGQPIQLLANADYGPYPTRPEVQTVALAMSLDKAKPALSFPPSAKEPNGIEIPCLKIQ